MMAHLVKLKRRVGKVRRVKIQRDKSTNVQLQRLIKASPKKPRMVMEISQPWGHARETKMMKMMNPLLKRRLQKRGKRPKVTVPKETRRNTLTRNIILPSPVAKGKKCAGEDDTGATESESSEEIQEISEAGLSDALLRAAMAEEAAVQQTLQERNHFNN